MATATRRHLVPFSDEIGKAVLAADGTRLGRLRDLAVAVGGTQVTARELVVGRRGGARWLVPWEAVGAIEPRAIRLSVAAGSRDLADDADLASDELLLCRDVLDAQIFDARGRRVVRVSDVLLELTDGGGLEVAAVDVSMGGVLRRLGLRVVGNRLPTDAVAWRDLHLTSGRGHSLQLVTAGAAVHRLDSRGLATLVTGMDADRAGSVLRAVGADRAAEAVARAHPDVRDRLRRAAEDRGRGAPPGRPPSRRPRWLRLAGWRKNHPLPRDRAARG